MKLAEGWEAYLKNQTTAKTATISQIRQALKKEELTSNG
jgi:uncharacterized protein YqeY